MSKAAQRAQLTSTKRIRRYSKRLRPRLEVEFSSFACRPSVDPLSDTQVDRVGKTQRETPKGKAWRQARTSSDVELFCRHVATAIATEAATGSLATGGKAGAHEADLESRLSHALDLDIAGWLVEVKHPPSTNYARLVRMLKERNTRSTHSRDLLLAPMLDAALDALTMREGVGPRPNVSVLLFVPGSYAQASRAEPLQDIDLALVYRGVQQAPEEIEDLANAMTPNISLPTPPVVLQARRNAQVRAELLSEFGALTAAEVAELAGSEAKNASALAGRWRREGRLVAVDHHGTTYYPAFQIDADGRPKAVVAEVLKHLSRPDTTPWQQALWFTTANGWLDGRRPVDLIEEEPEAIIDAAREALREPVG